MSSMLGCVAPVTAIVSPSHPSPAVSHKTCISANGSGRPGRSPGAGANCVINLFRAMQGRSAGPVSLERGAGATLGTPLGVRCVFYLKSSAGGASPAYHELKLVEHRQRGLPGLSFAGILRIREVICSHR